MIYRTSQRGTYRNINTNLGTLSYRIAQLTGQVSSEQRINKPSDDPSGAASVLRTRSVISDIYQYKENLVVSDTWLTASGSNIQSIKNTLDEVFIKAEQGSTDTYNNEQRQIMKTEIDLLFNSIVKNANQKLGDHYIFAGQKFTTPPFSLQMEAQKVFAGCQNSEKWTGQVLNYGDPAFNYRPDLPIQSQNFLVEVVQAGGVDSRFYTEKDDTTLLKINGTNSVGDYTLRFDSQGQAYNNTEIKLVSGPTNTITTGSVAQNNGLTYASTNDPTDVVYQSSAGLASSAFAVWSAATNTIFVSMRPGATAGDVRGAVNAIGSPVTASFTGASTGAGAVGAPAQISFNHNATTVSVSGNQITVYLERDTNVAGGGYLATADDIIAAISGHPQASLMVTASGSGPGGAAGSLGIINPSTAFQKLQPGEPYTLARATVNPQGTQNDVLFSIKNHTTATGSAGNNYSVQYVYPGGVPPVSPGTNTAATANLAGNVLTITLGMSASVYMAEYKELYYDARSPYYNSAQGAANEAALRSITTTGNDVISAVNHSNASAFIFAENAEGNSGFGKVRATTSAVQFAEGYDQAAMFRVSQDGGKTWGPPQAFAASEFKTGDMFYNEYLGHASMTTDFPGKGNDLVFTALHQGTWGNDVRVEYKIDPGAAHPQALKVTAGPNPYNVCVNLKTSADGTILSTANDIMAAINSHASASQWMKADLAVYHEGGNGIVDFLDCTSLSVGEPFQINGKTQITPLGHATATIDFPYKAPKQSDPNIIFQALNHGDSGNKVGIRYTTSADPTFYSPPSQANSAYQEFTSVRYESRSGKTVVVVHLDTREYPTCPPGTENTNASPGWRDIDEFKLYACSSSRAVTSTTGAVLEALMKKNMDSPQSALVWGSMERWPEGWDSTARVGPTTGTVWLTGGDDGVKAENHGVNLRFIPDGTAMQVGDIFEVPVGWYAGDEKHMDINVDNGYRTSINATGADVLGNNGDEDNILDVLMRLSWALQKNDTEMIGAELPKVRTAIEKVTTMETVLGTQMIRNQFVAKNLDDKQYNAEDFLSRIEDVDFSAVITNLKNAQTVYEAVLGTTGMTTKLSLLNYI